MASSGQFQTQTLGVDPSVPIGGLGCGLVPTAFVGDHGGVTTQADPGQGTEPGQGSSSASTQASTQGGTPRASRYAMGSLPNMARSLLVIVALLLAFVAIVPRSDLMSRPSVDATAVVANAVKESGTAFEAPAELGEGWTPTSARYAPSTDGLRTWQAVWTTPSGQSISLKQTVGATPGWVSVATNQARASGSVELGGRTWERREDARGQVNLVAKTPDGLTTVVSGTGGTGGTDEIGTFVAAFRPAPAG